MNIMNKVCNKALAKTISRVCTNIAYTSTKKCVTLSLIEEPQMPKILLQKAK
ncbi:cyclic lactone autoinducer peptide [Clostridium botulinum]|uniref:cyclic lactone autoinducer peptide n=1 Tax=Clostridium botulinum TaxID=1491 RepID=UPI000AF49E27|nr:cyclic lactone autoinducer peptide [Clostridium botulinum]MCD3351695.1 cyclic lactone autoinducer peptide [Clostridium botulinum D/C]MCD3360595.1 cyclic lactone autoinducer peptide [Clostridium botulinum D/C]MCD3363781.1 cyclic lactone autoinducer peptide [Clostridium botulinum D/C]MCD3366370.1 cyclic lactone autoinducer peptide [Clostridium botulinum D/C]QPW61753.1 cyclic lactone autoinducer peptide [Clostridium botulinum]